MMQPQQLCFVFLSELFAGSDCTSGASVSASTAVQAGVGIDRIDVAFLDCVGGTYCLACSTCYTAIRNYVSHISVNLKVK